MKEPFAVITQALEIPKLSSTLRVVHLGDLHERRFGEENAELVTAVIRSKPNLMLVTGDVLDRRMQTGDAFLELIARLGGRFPVYASIGNHELSVERSDPSAAARFYKQSEALGVRWLRDEAVRVEVDGQPLWLAGLTYSRSLPGPAVIRSRLGICPLDAPVVALAHNPNHFPALAVWGAALSLSGHVHGGLIRFPFVGGLFGPEFKPLPRFDRGLYRRGGRLLNVTAGFGSRDYLRLFNPRALDVLEISPAGEGAARAKESGASKAAGAVLWVGWHWRRAALWTLILLSGWICLAVLVGAPLIPLFLLFNLSLAAVLCKPEQMRREFRRQNRWRWINRIVAAGVGIGAAFGLIMSGFMLRADAAPPIPGAPVAILGAQVVGANPSGTLWARIQAAETYLRAYPDAMCIVTGGQGPDEGASEASVEYRVLVAGGIAPDRILVDDTSLSTYENFRNTAEIMRRNNLGARLNIATDGFHMLRASLYAHREGLTTGALPSRAGPYVTAYLWYRDICGLAKLLVVGH